MFDLRIPESLASLPGRKHVCEDDSEESGLFDRVMKVCKCCGESKPESDYSMRKEGYLRSYCKPCMTLKANEWNRTHRERINERKRAMRTAK